MSAAPSCQTCEHCRPALYGFDRSATLCAIDGRSMYSAVSRAAGQCGPAGDYWTPKRGFMARALDNLFCARRPK